jgi:hypothetical protein
MYISRCNSTTDASCASDAVFGATEAAMGSFTLVLAIVNTNINPGSEDYRQFYLEDRNIF